MPGYDRKIDPVTKDYIDDGAGSWEQTTTIATSVYHQLQGELNGWWGDPDAGCQLFTLDGGRNGVINETRARDMVRVALKPFIKAGLAEDLSVETEREVNRLFIAASIRDIQYGTLDLTPMLPFGA